MPAVEIGIALSAVALGAMIASRPRPPLWVAAVLVGAFAIFHGHAHGAELPRAANPLAYGLGFVSRPGCSTCPASPSGSWSRWPLGERAVRATDGLIAVPA